MARRSRAAIGRVVGTLVCVLALLAISTSTNVEVRAASDTNPCGPNILVRGRSAGDPIEAAFTRRSYGIRARATLRVTARARHLVLQLFRTDGRRAGSRHSMAGRAVTKPRRLALPHGVATSQSCRALPEASASRRSSSGRADSRTTVSPSSCQPTPGRRTTSEMRTVTESATRGMPIRASGPSGWLDPTSTMAFHRT